MKMKDRLSRPPTFLFKKKMKNGLNIDEDGSTVWYLNGELHREDGPAIERPDGSKSWWLNGERHRVDGPAAEIANHPCNITDPLDDSNSWWLNGFQLIHPEEFKTMEEFIQHLNNNEEYSLQWINEFNGIINMIKNPTGKQSRLHAMRWKI